ncbi:MAG: hypothetical protein RBT40_02075 [Petrimonas sp.]|jgi:DNA-binding MarR family transcriptional regulator|nr:hypothetical protein [Petrimonas sp.]
MTYQQNDKVIKLTFRQKAFLSKLLDVYREMKEPLHYSVIAERLGVSNSTAYDMFKLLEQKGMITSHYATPKVSAGPGRSNVLFSPTNKTEELFSNLAGNSQQRGEWEDVKVRILAGLEKGQASGYQDVIQELLTMIPEAKSSLVQCAEVITALLLSLKESRQELETQGPINNLLAAPASKLRMSILGGLILGLSMANNQARRALDLSKYTEKYEASLQELSKENLLMLHQFTSSVLARLKKAPSE